MAADRSGCTTGGLARLRSGIGRGQIDELVETFVEGDEGWNVQVDHVAYGLVLDVAFVDHELEVRSGCHRHEPILGSPLPARFVPDGSRLCSSLA